MQLPQQAMKVLPKGAAITPKASKFKFSNPNAGFLGAHIHDAARRYKAGEIGMVERGRHEGTKKGLLLCSTGPSLMDRKVLKKVNFYLNKRGFDLCALKESIPFLLEKTGCLARYSVGIDPGGDRQVKRTPAVPGVTYCLASSCNPLLYQHLLDGGCDVDVYHSACGYHEPAVIQGIALEFPGTKEQCIIAGHFDLKMSDGAEFSPVACGTMGELAVYAKYFGQEIAMTGGFTVTNRALALMKFMGYTEFVLAGTDFGWREAQKRDSHYADFVEVKTEQAEYMTDNADVDGKTWCTRPDQIASAVDIAWKIKRGELKVIGDTLPNALAKRDDTYLKELVTIK